MRGFEANPFSDWGDHPDATQCRYCGAWGLHWQPRLCRRCDDDRHDEQERRDEARRKGE